MTYRGTSLTRKCTPLGTYRRPMSRVVKGSWGGERFLMGEAPLYKVTLLIRRRYPTPSTQQYMCRGTSLIRNRRVLGTYSSPMPSPTVIVGGGAVSYEQGTPVDVSIDPRWSWGGLDSFRATCRGTGNSRIPPPPPPSPPKSPMHGLTVKRFLAHKKQPSPLARATVKA